MPIYQLFKNDQPIRGRDRSEMRDRPTAPLGNLRSHAEAKQQWLICLDSTVARERQPGVLSYRRALVLQKVQP